MQIDKNRLPTSERLERSYIEEETILVTDIILALARHIKIVVIVPVILCLISNLLTDQKINHFIKEEAKFQLQSKLGT